MSAVGQIATPAGLLHEPRPLSRLSGGTLLFLIGIIYAGGIQFFLKFSPGLLNGTYAIILGCVALCLFFDWPVSRRFQTVSPYMLWLAVYFLWGMFVLAQYPAVFEEGIKVYIKNTLVIRAVVVVLDRRMLKPFAQIVQVGVIANFGLCVWEAFDPILIERIAKFREEGATAFNVLRPAGLWSNPDESASAFIFSILMARWSGRFLGWLGAISSIVGIYLGASRTGAILLLLCGFCYGLYWLRGNRLTATRMAFAFGLMLVAGITAVTVAVVYDFDPEQHWQLARMLDLTESSRRHGEASRTDIAKEGIRLAIEGPWYGHGLFTYQFHGQATFPCAMDPAAHNVFLVVWGETGMLMGIAYLLLLGAGLLRALRTPMHPGDRLSIVLMWICYLLIGLTWHNQFTSFSGMIYIALMWHLPSVVATRTASPGYPATAFLRP